VPFPRRLLNDGEVIALDMRPHWWFFARPIAAGLLLVIALAGALKVGNDDARSVSLYAVAAAAVVWAAWLGVRFLKWHTTNFVVTSDRLIFRAGVLGKRGQEIPLERVNDISFDRTLWDRIIGSGDLLIESAGERGQQTFTDIPHPDAVQQVIYREIKRDSADNRGGR